MPRTSSAVAEEVAQAPLEMTWNIATPMTPVGFYPKFGPLPAVVGVEGQTGGWDAPGQHRTLHLSDGGTVREEIVSVDRPAVFVYELTQFSNLFAKLVAGARAEWRFSAHGGGTRIHWTYTFTALPGRGVIVAVIVKLFWAPYMKKVLPGIVTEVEKHA